MISFTSQQAAVQAASQRSGKEMQQHRAIKKKDAKSWLVINAITKKIFDVNGEVHGEDLSKINLDLWHE